MPQSSTSISLSQICWPEAGRRAVRDQGGHGVPEQTSIRSAPSGLPRLAEGGEMGALIREFDWAATPIGPVESWSPALRTMVSILLANRFPLLLWWGPHYIQLYNDPYRPIPGTKHPARALGRPASECWPEIWHILEPLIDTPFQGGSATWMEDILLEIDRYGFLEETHFTIAYSPVPDETAASGIGGVLATVHEITEKVVAERRVATLRDLGARTGDAKTAEEACATAAKTLAGHDKDVPFVLLYLIDADGKRARLAGSAGVGMAESVSPLMIDLSEATAGGWPLAEARRSAAMQVVERLGERFATVPPGPWSDPPDTAVALPIPSNKPHQPAGLLVAGVSARLKLDESYRGFFELMTTQVATAIANARAYEEERRRAEALAELDRAKTEFFSNVSHEFRTPLTLMLGPLEDTLAQSEGLSAEDRERLEVTQRNSLRLLKLVNTLLDFSRIEAGRIEAVYEPIDLAAFTAELASVFRSAIERAGLRLVVDCPPLAEVVYVDPGMWEKVVLNLLSNAFKFTFAGEIEVALRQAGELVELAVRDTGTGIPTEAIPHLFERFHRVKGARGRSFEGSGIGLALVQELVRLHGGAVRVASEVDRGTTFTVSIPTGKAHLPADRIGAARTLVSTGIRGEAYVEEVLRWLPNEGAVARRVASGSMGAEESHPIATAAERAPRVLLADDNADMREYVRRLLGKRYEVEAVADGLAAVRVARERTPDLVLSDVMMPGLDGFGLLRELRADERTATVPVILLSARAGEESRIEGLEAGADDYLVKPFSARELLARVGACLEISRIRDDAAKRVRASEERLRLALSALQESDRRKNEFLALLGHELRNPMAPIRNAVRVLRLSGGVGDGGDGGDGALGSAIDMIERQAAQMVRLIDDLLDASRITSGKIELQKERIELAPVVSHAIEVARPLCKSMDQELTATLPAEPIHLKADPARLIQVVGNLLNNASKFTERGGRIRLTVEREGDEVAIRVQDTGIGLAEDQRSRIFEMFMQVDRSLERTRGGLGIGLALVKELVEMHGGTVEAHSAGLGRGSEFVVRFPALTEPPQPAPRDPSAAGQAAVPRRILVVDDNRDSAESLATLLELGGHQVHTAYDGLEAVGAAAKVRPDVILLDIGLPKLNGYEAARRIREQPGNDAIVLVALTGWGQEEDRERSRDAGFDRHMVKPVEYDALKKVLAELRG
jgi:signal transduction histidine kinase